MSSYHVIPEGEYREYTEVTGKCPKGHALVFKNKKTGEFYTPIRINNTTFCAPCLMAEVGVHCDRSHMMFEARSA